MKIVCGKCGARYSIADDKVAGRAVRIRCKLCGDAMVVRGDSATVAPPPGPDATDAPWHLVVDGEQQGPFRAAEVTRMLAAGDIDEHTYAWRSGLAGWLRVHEIPELAAAPGPFAGGAVVVSSVQSAAELGAGAGAAMTGARSESSVLFSLGNLQSLALRGRPGHSAPRPSAAPGGSGLLDLRALVGAAPAAAPTGAVTRGIDDLLGVGAAGAFPSMLVVPVTTPASARSGRLLHVLVATAATLLLGIIALLAVALRQSPSAPVAPPPPPQPIFVAPATRAPVAALPASPASPAPDPSPAAALPAPDIGHPRTPSVRRPAIDPSPARPIVPAGPESPRVTGPETIEDLVRRAVGPEPPAPGPEPRDEPRPEPRSPVGLPAQPDRADVHAALRAVQGPVRACAAGQVGTASIRFVFAPNGAVTTATVTSPPFSGTPAGSCMARAARAARVPPFSRTSLAVTFPFVVR